MFSMSSEIYRCAIFTYNQTSLSESYNYQHFRTATNVSAITYISITILTRTRKN